MYRFCLVCMCVCLSGCQKLIISSLYHIVHSPGGDPFRHVCLSDRAQVSVRDFFAHLTDFVQLLITFKHCLGMLTKKAYPHPTPTHTSSLAVAVSAIQPWDDSRYLLLSILLFSNWVQCITARYETSSDRQLLHTFPLAVLYSLTDASLLATATVDAKLQHHSISENT